MDNADKSDYYHYRDGLVTIAHSRYKELEAAELTVNAVTDRITISGDSHQWTEAPTQGNPQNNENMINLNTSGIIGLVFSLLALFLILLPSIRLAWKNFVKYVNDEKFKYQIRFGQGLSNESRGGYVTFWIVAPLVGLIFSFIITVISSKYPIFILGALGGTGIVALINYTPRMIRFLVRGKKAIGKIGAVAHTHDETGKAEDVEINDPKY